ncbi:hypothetical protein Ais01nite_84050 [Asanoa ishikariensis]|nr:hypothetical protein Ais01nite_84050 [Asanoa ishikariensis]
MVGGTDPPPDRPPPTEVPTETGGFGPDPEAAALAAPDDSELPSGALPPSPGVSGGGVMPGARVNLGDGASAGTTARPTAARPVADEPLSAVSPSAGVVEAPAVPDFACVSVIN